MMSPWYLVGTVAWLVIVGAWRLCRWYRPPPALGGFHAWQLMGAVGYFGLALWQPTNIAWLLAAAVAFMAIAPPLDHMAGLDLPARYYGLELLLYVASMALGVASWTFLGVLI